MKKLLFAGSLVLAFVVAPVHAQLKLPSLGKKPAATESSAAPPSGDALVTGFVQSQDLVLSAQGSLAEALDLKDELTLVQVEQKRLSSGQVDTDSMKKRRELTDNLQATIDAKVAAQPALTAEARAKFGTGLVDYLKAVVGARELLLQAQQYTSSVGANPMALAGKAKSAMWVGKETPGYLQNLVGTSRALLDYAKRNNIKTPANATAALEGL